MKTIILAVLSLLAVGCTDPSTWDKSFNPLDTPATSPLTVEEMHRQNIRNIRGY